MTTLSKEELQAIKNSPPAQPKSKSLTKNQVKDNNTVSNSLRNRFHAEEYKQQFEKLEEFVNIPICVFDVTINTGTGKDGSQFKAVLIECVDLEGNEHKLSSSAAQPVNMLKDMQQAHYSEDKVFPCWMIAKKEKTSSGRMAMTLDFPERDYPIPGSVEEAFGSNETSEDGQIPF